MLISAELSTEGSGPKVCRHCRREPANRPRGLGWKRYYTPGVKDLYPSTSKFARRGAGNITGVQPLPAKPTDAVPGSAEKVAVLEARAAAGESLWHPKDADWSDVGRKVEAERRSCEEETDGASDE